MFSSQGNYIGVFIVRYLSQHEICAKIYVYNTNQRSMSMFDPSKLDIDFSDTSDVYKIEKEKIKAEEKTEARRQEKARDVLSEIDSEDKNKDTIVLDNNKKAEDERFKKQDDTELDMHLNRKQDKETLSTIITDSELVEKDSELKAYKEQKEEERNNNDEEKILFDINIAKLGDLVGITLREKYDYFRIEPTEDFVRICFVKDNVDKEKKYIKYPAYSKILLEIKKAGKLKLDITEKEQKGKAEYDYLDRRYSTIVKTKPEATGEKVYFKIQEIAKVAATKKKDKISFSKILWFLVALLLTTLLIGGLFLGFVLFNSNSIADLKFFNDLWVDVDGVRQFVAMLVNAIFFSIVFILTAFSITFIFKAVLTKKSFKSKKISSAIIAVVLLIITFATWFLWLSLSKKVAQLKWLNYGKPVIYDNAKLLSSFYESPREAEINAADKIIWPVTLKFDVSEFLEKLRDDGNTIQKLTWIFDNETIEKPAKSDDIIRDFSETWLQTVNLIVDILDLEWEEQKEEKLVANLDIWYVVDIKEKLTSNGWKRYSFNANSLNNLGDIEWYFIPNLDGLDEAEKEAKILESISNPELKWNVFSPQIVLFDEEIIVWMYIDSKGKAKNDLDRIFIMNGEGKSDIKGEIKSRPSLSNDLNYYFSVTNLENSFGNGFIEAVTWKIDGKEIRKEIDNDNVE